MQEAPDGDGTSRTAVRIGDGLLGSLGRVLQEHGVGGRAFVVSDAAVAALHAPTILTSLASAGFRPTMRAVAAGEARKSLATAADLYGWLASERAERRDVVVALGGGVVGDLAGFVAATYVRGLDVVQVPTTLIAQTDSAVGGKTGVNLDAGKNLVGAWHPPRLVVLDPTVLRTLPRRHVVAGWAETIKHALVRDAGLLALLDAHVDALLRLDPILTGEVVARSVAVKCDVVAQDPREQGIRVVLNYGHTIGHGVEHASGYALHHGEAVSVGMVSAARLGAALGVTPPALVGLHRDLLFRFGLPVDAPGIDDARVRAAMQRDKKADDAAIRWVLLHEIAQPVVRRDVPDRVVAAVVAETCRA